MIRAVEMLKTISIIIVLLIPFFSYSQTATIYIDSDKKEFVALAKELSEKFEHNTGKKFFVEISSTTPSKGIYITLKKEFLPAKIRDMGSEAVYIKGDSEKVLIGGNSVLALKHAVHLYLFQLGYRFYFPNPVWHISPSSKKNFTDFEILHEPSYKHRRIWYAYGTDSKDADLDYNNWVKCNMLGGALNVNAGHSYEGIIKRNLQEFEKHPEYFALTEKGTRETTKTGNPKFCFSNEGLIKLCTKDVLNQFAEAEKSGKPLDMVSMDPSDGWNTCNCENCVRLGTTSDRVFYLANRVAKEVNVEYPGKWIGLYAYANHAEPTKLDLEPNVFVMVATAYNKTKYTTDQLVQMWGRKASEIGIREYYGVMAWDWDMPGLPKVSNTSRTAKDISKFHKAGAVAMSAETNIGWISRGLGQYVAARLLWDVNDNPQKIIDDFYEKSFGKTKKQIRELFSDWLRNSNQTPTENDISKWLKLIKDAEDNTRDSNVRERINQIKAYMHYVCLYYDWKKSDKINELKTYGELLNYTWRIKDLGICASYPLARRIANTKAPEGYNYKIKNSVWKQNSNKVTSEELDDFFRKDLNKYHSIQNLRMASVPSNNFQLLKKEEGASFEGNRYRGPHTFIIEIPEDELYSLSISGGYTAGNKKEIKAELYNLNAGESALISQLLKSDQQRYEFDITNVAPGKYKLSINDNGAGFSIKSENINYSLYASSKNKIWSISRNNFYFYVPKETKVFILEREGPLTLKKPNGQKLSFQKNESKTIKVELKEGEDGLWQILDQRGKFYLMGIPEMVSSSPADIILPDDAMN